MAKSFLNCLEYSTQFKKDFKKITKLPFQTFWKSGALFQCCSEANQCRLNSGSSGEANRDGKG